MSLRVLSAVVLATGLSAAGIASAEQPSANPAPPAPAVGPAASPLDNVPEKMPFNIPYGTPISLEKAQAAAQAAIAEANKHGWPLNVAVVDSGGNLVAFARMDGAQLGSIAISEHKARAAAKYRRPTHAFEDAMQRGLRLCRHARRRHRLARRHSLDRRRQADRRDRLLRRHRLAGRGGVHGRRRDHQQISRGNAGSERSVRADPTRGG